MFTAETAAELSDGAIMTLGLPDGDTITIEDESSFIAMVNNDYYCDRSD